MKVLYIGGTGEISYACVRASLAAGQKVTVFNRGSRGEKLPEGVEQVTGDAGDEAAVAYLGERHFDAVCQFITYTVEQAHRDHRAFAGRCGQFVFISSASGYQKPPKTWRITEDVPMENPYWQYSRNKAAVERLLLQWHEAGEMPVTIVRPSHTYRTQFAGTFVSGDDWAWRMRNRRKIVSHGDGTSLWTVTRSEDFAVPFVRLLGNRRALGEAFHITSDETNPWDTIFRATGAALGVEPDIVHVPTDTLLRYNRDWEGPLLGDKANSVWFDNSKVKAVAGDFTCKPMAEGVKLAAEHYFKRADRFEPDRKLHALIDRIAKEQLALGGA